MDYLRSIVGQFRLEQVSAIEPFGQRGNINLDTYVVRADGEYLLQRLNTDVFSRPERVMKSMVAWVEAQRIASAEIDWIPIELVPTNDGEAWLETETGEWWRVMHMIPDCVSYKSLADVGERAVQLALAEEMGRGLAMSADLTSDLDPLSVETALPGYRNTELYVQQFRSVAAGAASAFDAVAFLPDDDELRECTEALFHHHLTVEEAACRREDPVCASFIELIHANADWAGGMFRSVHEGSIRRTAIHGDTKIENFLFSRTTGRVQSLVDLDTIMPYTWLADWGDMVRSLCNVAGEKERDLTKIRVDRDVYAAVARGFLGTARACPLEEIEMMPAAVATIAFELGVRFFTDYLRGDNYFSLGEGDPPDLNLVRGQVQLTLFERLMHEMEWSQRLIRSLVADNGLVSA